MTVFEKNLIVNYSQQQMYALVADVAAYPDFLPWCQRVEILSNEEDNKLVRLVLQYKTPLPLSITTRAAFRPPCSLELQMVEGSFLSAFHGSWHFTPLPSGGTQQCRVTFRVSYRFANPLLRVALAPFFSMVVRMLPALFISRAQQIYPSGN